MKARILKSQYPEVAIGTIGEVIARCDNGLAVRVDGNFTVPGATATSEVGQRDCFFERDEVEIIREGSASAPELVFLSALSWLADVSHSNSVEKGFWQSRNSVIEACKLHSPELVCYARKLIDSQLRELIISELGEACEGDRKDLMDDHCPKFTMVECELADVLIRLGDYIKARGLRVGEAVIAKLKYNSQRPKMHGKQF